jgi:hypothetical protein
MLLTISTTHHPATGLGYLLYKHRERVQTFPLTFGQAHVFYPEATAERCTAALLLDINPVALVRRDSAHGFALAQYVNDRPYVASSFLSVAIAQVFGSALAGTSRDRPALAETPLPLEATMAVLPCRGGEGLLRRLFERPAIYCNPRCGCWVSRPGNGSRTATPGSPATQSARTHPLAPQFAALSRPAVRRRWDRRLLYPNRAPFFQRPGIGSAFLTRIQQTVAAAGL